MDVCYACMGVGVGMGVGVDVDARVCICDTIICAMFNFVFACVTQQYVQYLVFVSQYPM